ncbi:MAG: ferritin-like domain-containing protein [Bacillota bacterium]
MQHHHEPMLPLTEKDLAYLHDMLSWELVATKKAYQYAHQTLEPDCRHLMFRMAEQHQRNWERLLGHLQEHVDRTIQANIPGGQAALTGAQPLNTHA